MKDRDGCWEMEAGSNLGGLCGPQLDWSWLNEVPEGQRDGMVRSLQCMLPARWASSPTHTPPKNVLPLCLILITARLFLIWWTCRAHNCTRSSTEKKGSHQSNEPMQAFFKKIRQWRSSGSRSSLDLLMIAALKLLLRGFVTNSMSVQHTYTSHKRMFAISNSKFNISCCQINNLIMALWKESFWKFNWEKQFKKKVDLSILNIH